MAHHELVAGLEKMIVRLDLERLVCVYVRKLELEIVLLERRCTVVGREADKLDLEITLLERQVLERGEDV